MGKMHFSKREVSGQVFFELAIDKGPSPVIFNTSTRTSEDLAAFCRAINIDVNSVVQVEQVHGDTINHAKQKDAGKTIPGCDALITAEALLPLAVRTADCQACFIFDPVSFSIGLAHAGWRGTTLGIAAKTLIKMGEHFDTRPKDCIIALSPAIGRCCFEVDALVKAPLEASCPYWKEVLTAKKGGKWMLDLEKLNVLQLAKAGVLKDNIISAKRCTSCENDIFYSFRKEGTPERMYSVAMLKEKR